MILVSVIIPFYSSTTGLLTKAVESALSQTIENLEVIIIDDCSPVSGAKELELINDDRVRIIRHSKNSNGGIARNTGIDNAAGEYVAFLDYDDIWYEDKLEKQYNLFKANSISYSNLVVYSMCKIIDGNRTLIRPTRPIKEKESVGQYLFCAKQIIQTSGIFLKTSLAKEVKFDDLKRHQDYQFCLYLENLGAKFVMLEDVSYEFIQIPKLNDYHFSLTWLDTYYKYLDYKAVRGFKGLVILRSIISHKKSKEAFKFAFKEKLLINYFYIIFLKLSKEIYLKAKKR
ncbi:glycosyltransferase family 2 protein [Pseudoalteromonas sp. SR41-4]|uniref:glycosyltransferase family 2 protein n=1 Tax=Pseudoalteromonas sp. SR41-4 TaxID=2760950 RepID=UPI00160370DF|nr:glycosyltransferase family 2 protein [Pseudoalteromonas sp. SR41-4]MBB1295373.1 glycosyltransferase family 2 protein [Pseudoalteromonas sp. SR41-4]